MAAETRITTHRVVLFGKLAEIAGQYLKKGSQVYLEGKLKTRKWQDKDGVERYTTEISADVMKMLGGRGDGQQNGLEKQFERYPCGCTDWEKQHCRGETSPFAEHPDCQRMQPPEAGG